jgi:hypothetical protein
LPGVQTLLKVFDIPWVFSLLRRHCSPIFHQDSINWIQKGTNGSWVDPVINVLSRALDRLPDQIRCVSTIHWTDTRYVSRYISCSNLHSERCNNYQIDYSISCIHKKNSNIFQLNF